MEPRNFLLASLDEPLVGDVAWRVVEEGHDVKYFVASDTESEAADEFAPKTDDGRRSPNPSPSTSSTTSGISYIIRRGVPSGKPRLQPVKP